MREEKKFPKRENNISKESPNYKYKLTSPALCLNSFKLISTDLQSGVVIVWCVVSCFVGISNSSYSLRIPYHSLVLGSLNMSEIFFMVSPLTSKKVYIMYNYTYKFQVFPSFFTKFQVFPSFFFYKIPGFSRFYGHTFSNTWNSKKVGIKFIMLNILNVIPTFLLFQ